MPWLLTKCKSSQETSCVLQRASLLFPAISDALIIMVTKFTSPYITVLIPPSDNPFFSVVLLNNHITSLFCNYGEIINEGITWTMCPCTIKDTLMNSKLQDRKSLTYCPFLSSPFWLHHVFCIDCFFMWKTAMHADSFPAPNPV